MVWNIVLQLGASILMGAAVGYGVASIVDGLSETFAKLYQSFSEATEQIWGYVKEATQHILASIAQWMDRNWAEIEEYLRQEIGYRREWWIVVFQEMGELIVGFIDPHNYQNRSQVSFGPVNDQNAQLPTNQDSIVHKLELQ
jgi:hypothetical protein